MSEQLQKLIEMARGQTMTPEQLEAQRINFAFGNMKLSNEAVTKAEIIRIQDHSREPPR